MIESNLLRFKKNQLYAIWDVESENLSLSDSKVWQSTLTLVKNSEIVEEIDDYVYWENLEMSEGAARITRFNEFDYKRRVKPANECLERLEKILYDPKYLIVGSNLLAFDVYLAGAWQERLGKQKDYSFMPRIIDVQALFKAFQLGIKEVPSDPNERLCFQYKYSNYRKRGLKSSVKFMCAQLGVEYNEEMAHNSLFDNRMVLNQWNKLVYMMEI